jgi:uncharacterized protein
MNTAPHTPPGSTPRPTALITGASAGIGKALATEFAQGGYNLVLVARSAAKLQALAESLQAKHGITATVMVADLETPDGAQQLHAAVKAAGITLSALVNNAGAGTFAEFKDTPLAQDTGVMQLNMASLVILSKLFLPDLLATQGKILNTASTAAFQPGPYMAVYYATKAFVLSFSEAMGYELKGSGVTVTALCPGPTASDFQDRAHMQASAMVKGKRLPSSESVAASGYRALQRGQSVYIPGVMNWLLAQSIRFTPRAVVLPLVQFLTKPV